MSALSLYRKIWFKLSTPQINESPLLSKKDLENKAQCFSLLALMSRQMNSFNLRRNRLFIDSLKNLDFDQLESIEIFLTLFTIEAEKGNLRTSLKFNGRPDENFIILGDVFGAIKQEIIAQFENIPNLHDLQNQ